MSISIADMFSIGIGPSSSHTVGPMRAAKQFISSLDGSGKLPACNRVLVELFGSLAHTGVGHGTDTAVLMGLSGEQPESCNPEDAQTLINSINNNQQLVLPSGHIVRFINTTDLKFHRRKILPEHPNGMRFTAYDHDKKSLLEQTYFSVGGGFIIEQSSFEKETLISENISLPYPFTTSKELLHQCQEHGLSISTLMLENETAWRSTNATKEYLLNIWKTMEQCVDKGCHSEGILPGGLKVKRRAAHLYRRLQSNAKSNNDPLKIMDWVNLYALAVNEENAAGGRVVTAPTNGAAGIIPAVLCYVKHFKSNFDEQTVIRFLLTAGAIGILFKKNASISGAEVGCQGEVGVACSMAAAGLAEISGGSVEQCEVAAEIAMEHNLGLTCDPVAGLVQIPCIERNAMAAVKAINAARLALHGDGSHKVSLDEVIKTMKETGADMQKKYKETAKGGLAVNLIEC